MTLICAGFLQVAVHRVPSGPRPVSAQRHRRKCAQLSEGVFAPSASGSEQRCRRPQPLAVGVGPVNARARPTPTARGRGQDSPSSSPIVKHRETIIYVVREHALTYRFSISTDPAFVDETTIVSDPIDEGADGATTWRVPVALADNTFYFWRVAARDAAVSGPFATARFLIDQANDPPSVPAPLSPAADSLV